MTAQALDLDYVRAVGEEVRARLFPTPSRVLDMTTGQRVEGPTPIPRDVGLDYQLPSGDVVEVVFVPVKTIQWVDQAALGFADIFVRPTPDPSLIRVYVADVTIELNLEFGTEPDPGLASDAIVALLRAITGVL